MINNIADVLESYLSESLDEIISDEKQNYFAAKEVKKPVSLKQVVREVPKQAEKKVVNDFVKPVFSTSDALSSLAKKSSKPANNDALIPLNDIIAKAQEAANAAQNLAELKKAVEEFDGCNLKKMATNTVFCDGNADSKIMIIGEAPGNDEDLQGVPFCGDSGQLLNDMFKAINMQRDQDYYMSNVIFWRPPGNRRPTTEELAICRPFLERHIELVCPKILILVGATSMTALTGITDPISKIRGKFQDFSPKFLPSTIKTFTIFHPSYLLRQSSKKKVAWLDMINLEKELNSIN